MTGKPQETVLCQICKQQKKRSQVLSGEMVQDSVVEVIRGKHPEWSSSGFICFPDLNHFRTEYVQQILETERGELSALEVEVVKRLKAQEPLSVNLNEEFDRQLTYGERMADRIAEFGGSWRFIIGFTVVFLVWIVINSAVLLWRSFDPYPFILLNLVLSGLAAIQAPIIMMSQNRQEAKDRLRAERDYQVNLKAELEIRQLSERMDHLLTQQWQRLLEIQQIQTELIEQVDRKAK